MEVSVLEKYFPWRTNTSDMRWNVLAMCKLLFILLIFNGLISKIEDPFLPFFLVLDRFNEIPGLFPLINKTLFLVSGILLTFNIRTRAMAGILGVSVLLILLGSKPIFRNHILICGCAFFLAALHKKDEKPFLLYYQLALVYIGAAVNKMFQLDWWTGVYMHNWMVNVLDNKPYHWVFDIVQNFSFAKGLSWFSMGLEIVVGVFLFLPRFRKSAIYLILFFHLILFTVTQERFGHFLDDVLIMLIAFVNKESFAQTIQVAPNWKSMGQVLKYLFDWDNQFKIIAESKNEVPLKVENRVQHYVNLEALKHILLSSAGFFFLLFFVDLGLRFLLDQPIQHGVQLIVYWGLFIFFSLPYKTKSKNTTVSTYSYQN